MDLGTLGRRPFAIRDNDEGTDSKSPELSVTLETIAETPESAILSSPVYDTNNSSSSPDSQGSPHNDSGMDLDSHTGGSIASTIDENPCSAGNTITFSIAVKSTSGDDATKCNFAAVTKSDDESGSNDGSLASQSDPSQGQQLLAGDIEEVDLSEMKLETSDKVDTEMTRTGKRKKLRQTEESGGKSTQKVRRSSSFLIPFFNRRDSFTVSFVKPSQSLLRRKAELKSSKEARKKVDDTLKEQEIEIESGEGGGDGEGGGEGDKDRLLEKEELSRTRRLMKKIARSIFNSLLDLKLFLW